MDENTRSLIGINKLVNKENTRGDINIEDIENVMIRDEKFSFAGPPLSEVKPGPVKQENKYEAELRALTEQLNLNKPEERRPGMLLDLGGSSGGANNGSGDSGGVSGGVSGGIGGGIDSVSKYTTPGPSSILNIGESGGSSMYGMHERDQSGFERGAPDGDSVSLPNDRFSVETQEKSRHREIRSTMEDMGISTYSFEKEKREDSKSVMLEEIDFLKDELIESNYSIDRIPVVSQSSSFEEIESVLRMLRHKCDRIKYCDFAEQFLMVGVYALEELFDGQKSYWGYTPDLTNWSSSVQLKLRRMRYDTSQIVSQVMYDYNIGPGTRLMLELIPSAIIHSKTRRNEAEKLKARDLRDSGGDSDKRVLDAVERLRDL